MHWIKKFLTFQEREEHRLGRVQLKIVGPDHGRTNVHNCLRHNLRTRRIYTDGYASSRTRFKKFYRNRAAQLDWSGRTTMTAQSSRRSSAQ